jgi:LPS export ABC transporter protein LptC
VLSHYPSQRQAEMAQPNITLYATNDQIWHISANKGRIIDQTQDIALHDQVRIELGKPNVTNLVLNTNNLFYEFAAHRAWNQNLVSFNREGTEGKADGLLIDLNTELFELHNNVEVRYQH